MEIANSRRDFAESWLVEMPEGMGQFELFDMLAHVIRERMAAGQSSIQVKPGFWKIQGKHVVYYWYGSDSQIDLAAELNQRPQNLVVNMSGKRPDLRGKPPYASDLYASILDDNDASVLMRDSQLSDQALNLWKRMIELGYAVTVYDEHNPGKSHKIFTDPSQLMKFFAHADSHFRRWRHVLSKPGLSLGETISFFNTRRYRELAGLDLLG